MIIFVQLKNKICSVKQFTYQLKLSFVGYCLKIPNDYINLENLSDD